MYDENVPFVETRSTTLIHPWHQFPVGKSKFFPAEQYGPPEKVKSQAYSFAGRAGMCFRAQIGPENGVPGVRIWRLADECRPKRVS